MKDESFPGFMSLDEVTTNGYNQDSSGMDWDQKAPVYQQDPPTSPPPGQKAPEEEIQEPPQLTPTGWDWVWAGLAVCFWGSSLLSTYMAFNLLLGTASQQIPSIPVFWGKSIQLSTAFAMIGTGLLEGGSLAMAHSQRKEEEEENKLAD